MTDRNKITFCRLRHKDLPACVLKNAIQSCPALRTPCNYQAGCFYQDKLAVFGTVMASLQISSHWGAPEQPEGKFSWHTRNRSCYYLAFFCWSFLVMRYCHPKSIGFKSFQQCDFHNPLKNELYMTAGQTFGWFKLAVLCRSLASGTK